MSRSCGLVCTKSDLPLHPRFSPTLLLKALFSVGRSGRLTPKPLPSFSGSIAYAGNNRLLGSPAPTSGGGDGTVWRCTPLMPKRQHVRNAFTCALASRSSIPIRHKMEAKHKAKKHRCALALLRISARHAPSVPLCLTPARWGEAIVGSCSSPRC